MSRVSAFIPSISWGPKTDALRTTVALLGLALCLVLVWGRVLDYGMSRDEWMFVPPAILLDDLALYRDVFFNHVPYGAWIFRGAEQLFGETGLLFSARIAICATWLILVLAVGLSVRRLSGSGGLAAVCVLFLMTGEAFLNQTGMAATNNLIPLALCSASVGLFLVATVDGPPRLITLALAGACLAAAAATKVSAVALIPPLLLGAFLVPAALPLRQRLKRVVAPFVVGGLIGGAPALAVLASDPATVWAHVVGFHTGPHVAWWEINAASEPGLALGFAGKVQIAHDLWFGSSAIVLCVVFLYLVLSGIRDPQSNEDDPATRRRALWIVVATLCATAAMSLVPSPGFPQYYAPPLVLLPFLSALAMRGVSEERRPQVTPVLLAAGLAMVAIGAPRLLPAAATWANLEGSTAAQSARAGELLRTQLEVDGLAEGPVATLMPIYPLEGGLAVYPEFATGPFAYRIADVTEPELARYYVMAGPQDLQTLFAQRPPAAILTGFVPELDASFVNWAEANGYQSQTISGISNRYGTAVLHLAPDPLAIRSTTMESGTRP
jgi:hypothetical protein